MALAVALGTDMPGLEHARQQIIGLLHGETVHGGRLLFFRSFQAAQLLMDLLGGLVQVAGPGVVAEAGPVVQHLVQRCRRQSYNFV